jgi:hypothetical protein
MAMNFISNMGIYVCSYSFANHNVVVIPRVPNSSFVPVPIQVKILNSLGSDFMDIGNILQEKFGNLLYCYCGLVLSLLVYMLD